MSRYVTIRDFSGGEVTRGDGLHAPNESQRVDGFLVRKGCLESPRGKVKYSGTIPAVGLNDGIVSHYRFYKTGHGVNNGTTTQQGWLVAKAGPQLWLDTSTVRNNAKVSGTTGNDWRPIDVRTEDVRESFASHNGKLYYSNATDGMRRWDGQFYKVGQAKGFGTGTTLVGSGTQWQRGNDSVAYGDAVFIADANGTFGTHTYRVYTTNSATSITLTQTSPANGGAWCNYIIARTHEAGMTAPAAPTVATAAGAGLATGTYYYKVIFSNTRTGYTSNASTLSSGVTATGTGHRVTVTIPTATDAQASGARIYRSKLASPTSYFYHSEVSRTALGVFANTTDSKPDAQLGDAMPDSTRDRPRKFSDIMDFNGHFWGFGHEPNELRWSTTNSPEYWPDYVFGLDNDVVTALDDNTLGGITYIGSQGDPIVAAVPEGGAWMASGNSGSNLLVFTGSKAQRFFGIDWATFAKVHVFNEGCSATLSAVNAGGLILWLTNKGLMGLPSGGTQPMHIYQRMDRLFEDRSSYGGRSYDPTNAFAAYHDGYYICVIPSGVQFGGIIYPTIIFYDVATGAITLQSSGLATTCYDGRSFAQWTGPGDSGELTLGYRPYHWIFKMFRGETYLTAQYDVGVYTNWRSGWMDLASTPEDLYKVKRLERVVLMFKQPVTFTNNQGQAASPYITVKTYADGCTGTAASTHTNVTLEASSSRGNSGYKHVVVCPGTSGVAGRNFCVDFASDTLPPRTQLLWAQMKYDVESNELENRKV